MTKVKLTPVQMIGWGTSLTFLSLAATIVIETRLGLGFWWTMLSALIRAPFLLLAIVGFLLWRRDRRGDNAYRP